MADFGTDQNLFMDGSVTRSLDIRLPDEIIAIMGRDLKIDYLGKNRYIMVSKKSDPFYPGSETKCTSQNIVPIPDKIKNRMKLQAGELVICEYKIDNNYLIIRKKAGAGSNDKQLFTYEHRETKAPVKNESRARPKSVYTKSDILVNPPLYPYQFKPEAFADYRPSTSWEENLKAKDILKLCGYVREVLNADGETALFLIWRFAFGINCNTIRHFSRTKKSVNGICEAFRFGCQRYLECEGTITNTSLKRAFQMVLSDYEIILLNKNKGIRWMSRSSFESGISIKELARCFQQRVFAKLEYAAQISEGHTLLNSVKIEQLSEYISNLPVEYGSLLLLRYYKRYDIPEIENLLNVSYVNGKIEYLRRVLSDRLGLTDKLISDTSFVKACTRCKKHLPIDIL